MSDKPKRQWYRFSLKTLLVAVSIITLWFGIHSAVTNHRTKMEAWAAVHSPTGNFVLGEIDSHIPLRLLLLAIAQRPQDFFVIERLDNEPKEYFELQADRLRSAFPEAKIVDISDP